MATQYQEIEQGKWIPWERHVDLACCSCGYVHEIHLRMRKGKPQLMFKVNGPATGGLRKHHEHECIKA